MNFFKALAPAAAVAVMCLSTNAHAVTLTYGDIYSLGSVTPGNPDNDVAQVDRINALLDLAAGNDQTLLDGYTYDRTSNFQPGTSYLNATTVGAVKEDPTDGTFNLGGGFLYLLAKYGNGIPGVDKNGFYVWYVGGLTGDVSVPTHGLSHMSVYNPGGSRVPDGASTLALLGLALGGLGFFGRRLRK